MPLAILQKASSAQSASLLMQTFDVFMWRTMSTNVVYLTFSTCYRRMRNLRTVRSGGQTVMLSQSMVTRTDVHILSLRRTRKCSSWQLNGLTVSKCYNQLMIFKQIKLLSNTHSLQLNTLHNVYVVYSTVYNLLPETGDL